MNGKNPDTGALEHTFAIITYKSNDLMQRIGHPRSPFIWSIGLLFKPILRDGLFKINIFTL